MFNVSANNTKLTVDDRDILTQGSVNAFCVCFDFSEEWEGLEKTALFRVGNTTMNAPVDEYNHCIIPREMLLEPNRHLNMCVYGKGFTTHDHFKDDTGDSEGDNEDENVTSPTEPETPENPSDGVDDGGSNEAGSEETDEVVSLSDDIEDNIGTGDTGDREPNGDEAGEVPEEPVTPPDDEPTEPIEEEQMELILSSIWVSLGTIREGITEKELNIGNKEEEVV